jgi:hypothetical protein
VANFILKALYLQESTLIPIEWESVWDSQPVWTVLEKIKISCSNGIRTLPIARRYTDYAIPAPKRGILKVKISNESS